AGRQFNQYHWIHVDTLTKIVDTSDSDLLRYYRDRWQKFPSRGPAIREYQDDRITLERFDPKKHKEKFTYSSRLSPRPRGLWRRRLPSEDDGMPWSLFVA